MKSQYGVLPLHSALEHMFEELVTAAFKKDNFSNYPPTDVYYENNESYVEIAVAKFKDDEISVEVIDKNLLIRGRKTNKEEVGDRVYLNKSIATRNFERKLNIPFQVEEVNYELKDGVLYLEIVPKIEEQVETKIKNKSKK